jgi:hypothetical protein
MAALRAPVVAETLLFVRQYTLVLQQFMSRIIRTP